MGFRDALGTIATMIAFLFAWLVLTNLDQIEAAFERLLEPPASETT